MTTPHAEPEPGQESVWDYPRPPRLEPTKKHIRIVFGGETLADTHQAYRVLETSHPPVYYIPLADIRQEFLTETSAHSFCEWKGTASYCTVRVGEKEAVGAGWFYPHPSASFAPITGHVAFYPSKMDACFVDEERAEAQPGDFYGGWITPEVVGPFKGTPGTMGW